MDVHIYGQDAAQRATECCEMVFDEDYRHGPVRKCPQVLQQIKEDWPAKPDAIIEVGLEPPPGAPINGFKLRMCRVQVIAGGKIIGHALRLDNPSIMTLDAYTASWALFEKARRA